MKFGSVSLSEAEGAILAHSLVLSEADAGTRPVRIPKGTCLAKEHLQDLARSGIEAVTVARLERGDIGEDDAAKKLAAVLLEGGAADGFYAKGAGAGRVNLYASGCGLVRINAEVVNLINRVDPMITLATVPDRHRVDADGMVATIKIISYAVPENSLNAACEAAEGAFSLRRPQFKTATLIETTIGGDVLSDKGRRSMAGRVERMGMALTPRTLVAHEVDALASAIEAASGDLIFVLTASATSDTLDVAPQALRAADGVVERFGMPVDPGNLLFLGQFRNKPVIGLPGCARSPALNGADWVLERVICGETVTHDDIAAMAVGGLLKEIPIRPMPREKGV
ncbi:molybdopterin-binding protein [Shimia sp. MMG029]|uniref:molybdopterin-binding protein n=1 Tax=Shimia sp. MMG029 TaxID=3021978 RepID=UPI0022FEE716|nr:molybdopterin-binding protein [Shimia sp. MMG029]MDA5557912.1 molybdopterin-binding protein [Shimia sp. MMG029]